MFNDHGHRFYLLCSLFMVVSAFCCSCIALIYPFSLSHGLSAVVDGRSAKALRQQAAMGSADRHQTPCEPQKDAEEPQPTLGEKLSNHAQGHYGSYGIYVKVLETGEEAGYNEDKPFFAASCYKLFLVMYVYESAAKGEIDLDRRVTYQGSDRTDLGGVLQGKPLGISFSTRELCRYAIVHSCNVAAKMLRRVYGYRQYRDYAASIGCPVSGSYRGNKTTAREMAILLMRVKQFAAVNPVGEEVLAFLEQSVTKDRIAAGFPDGIPVCNKTGDYRGYANDAAIVFLEGVTQIICVLAHASPGYHVHAEASRLAYEDVLHRYYGGGLYDAFTHPPSEAWYFSGFPPREDYIPWLYLENTEDVQALAGLVSIADGARRGEALVYLPPRSETRIYLPALVAVEEGFALRIPSSHPINAASVVSKHEHGRWQGDCRAEGIAHSAREWCFAELHTKDLDPIWLTLANPSPAEANCTATFFMQEGAVQEIIVALPPKESRSIMVNDVIGNDERAAIFLRADIPIIAGTYRSAAEER